MKSLWKTIGIKAISYKILTLVLTALAVFLFTGSVAHAFAIGFVDALGKFAIYVVHEFAWLKFGRQ